MANMLAILLAAATLAGGSPYFVPPTGWNAFPPPDEIRRQGTIAIWLPPKRNGENLMVSVQPLPEGESLQDEKSRVISDETNDGRTLLSVRAHATCKGTVAGTDISMRFGAVASQFYHVAVKDRRVYTFTYTYAPNAQPNPAVIRAFDSFCPP